jgi:hypothetical protein
MNSIKNIRPKISLMLNLWMSCKKADTPSVIIQDGVKIIKIYKSRFSEFVNILMRSTEIMFHNSFIIFLSGKQAMYLNETKKKT